MEIQFQTQTIPYLVRKQYDDLRQELTGELTIGQSLPPLGRVVDCFGLVLVQERTVDSGSVSVTGAIQAGGLYLPEGEEELQRLDLSIPFTVTKKVPTQPGTILFYWGWLRSLEARFVNSRKLLLRASLGSELTLLTPAELKIPQVTDPPAGLALNVQTYPLRLPLCAAEKEVQLADEVLMPEEGPGADRLLKALCSVAVEERRILGDKAVFKGRLVLRVLFQSEDGGLSTWTGSLPFSQYAELDSPREEEGHLDIQPILSHVEIDTDGQPDSRRLLINVTFTAQVILWADVAATLTQDAYYLKGDFAPQWQTLDLCPCLDTLETSQEQSLDLPPEAARALDWTLFSDQTSPVQGAEAAQGSLGVNLLYYDAQGLLQSKLLRRELRQPRRSEPSALWQLALLPGPEPKLQGRQLTVPLVIRERYCQSAALRTLAGGTLSPGQAPVGPSLIVKIAQGSLWDLARDNGSTVRAIQEANGLEGETLPGERLLLIPTGPGVANREEVTE